MAKLGGIKFGAAPVPAAISRPPVPRVSQGDVDEEDGHSEHHPQADVEHVEQLAELSEGEEEERARKERIAAKLAGMGGMRIGMMPMGMGPKRAHALKDENVPPISPIRAVPSSPPTLPQTLPQYPTMPPQTHPHSDDTSVSLYDLSISLHVSQQYHPA